MPIFMLVQESMLMNPRQVSDVNSLTVDYQPHREMLGVKLEETGSLRPCLAEIGCVLSGNRNRQSPVALCD